MPRVERVRRSNPLCSIRLFINLIRVLTFWESRHEEANVEPARFVFGGDPVRERHKRRVIDEQMSLAQEIGEGHLMCHECRTVAHEALVEYWWTSIRGRGH